MQTRRNVCNFACEREREGPLSGFQSLSEGDKFLQESH